MEPGTSETRLGSSSSRPVSLAGLVPGTIFANRYRVLALLGRGGMGEVYRADDLRLGQPVALKFLAPRLQEDPVARERLLAEVRSARTVSHPNVCRVYDLGEVYGRVFLTMEYIDGEDLRSLLRRIGRLPAGKALEVSRQLCAGLAAAHERGILHRDLKPANVMIDGRGQARLTDFGLAVELRPGRDDAPGALRDWAPELSGTPAYMAPERFAGEAATVQSDLYALGLVLYEVYTGRQAILASTLEGWRQAHSDSTPSFPLALAPEIEPAVRRAILHCLEKDPTERPSSAAQLAASLPGSDPLAAAVAAGETPSPELVAASGEEGTLTRKQAWRWLGRCLLALTLAVPLGSAVHPAAFARFAPGHTQADKARETLRLFGHPNPPADSTWWFSADWEQFDELVRSRSPREWFLDTPVIFGYRESPHPLFSWAGFGEVGPYNPAPRDRQDARLEFDAAGRLVTLVVGGLAVDQADTSPASSIDWSPMFAAARMRFHPCVRELAPKWRIVVPTDQTCVWEGEVGGNRMRLEAGAFRGRLVQFLLRPTDWKPQSQTMAIQYSIVTGALLVLLLLGAALAWRNVRLGRGDRTGALRLGVVVLAAQALFVLGERHWTRQPVDAFRVVIYLLGAPLFLGLAAWFLYLAIEPFMRRHWPQLLVAWTRLLHGRWRDPLVGQSLLAGVTTALVVAAIVPGAFSALARTFSLPLAVPRFVPLSLDGGLFWFLGSEAAGWTGSSKALAYVAVLLIARLALRRDRPAWVVRVAGLASERKGPVGPGDRHPAGQDAPRPESGRRLRSVQAAADGAAGIARRPAGARTAGGRIGRGGVLHSPRGRRSLHPPPEADPFNFAPPVHAPLNDGPARVTIKPIIRMP